MGLLKGWIFVIVGVLGIVAIVYWMQKGGGFGEIRGTIAKGSGGAVSTDHSVAAGVNIGAKIFYGKGRCGLCHTIGVERGGKCPNLDGAGDRLTRAFITEALMQPDAYLRLDYNPPEPKRYPARMPQVNKAPIGLNKSEIESVIAFVQSQREVMEVGQ